ncbi:MAG: hypothetical protein IVW57_19830 [Ktedonobacterales bacterium]|nr:hypothetical protein [Ktedonobacterales bacterium]
MLEVKERLLAFITRLAHLPLRAGLAVFAAACVAGYLLGLAAGWQAPVPQPASAGVASGAMGATPARASTSRAHSATPAARATAPSAHALRVSAPSPVFFAPSGKNEGKSRKSALAPARGNGHTAKPGPTRGNGRRRESGHGERRGHGGE